MEPIVYATSRSMLLTEADACARYCGSRRAATSNLPSRESAVANFGNACTDSSVAVTLLKVFSL
jgi:hypothetical protein